MAGFREFAIEFRRRATDYTDVTEDHVALYALDNDRLILIDDQDRLADFQAHDVWVGSQEEDRVSNLYLSGAVDLSGAIDGTNLIFDPDGVNPWCIDNFGTPSLSADNLDYMLRFSDCATDIAHVTIRPRDGNVIIGDNADTIVDNGDKLQVYGNVTIDGNLLVTGEIDPSTDGGFAGSRTMLDFDASTTTVNVSGWTEVFSDNEIAALYGSDPTRSGWKKETYLSEDVISWDGSYTGSEPSQTRSFDFILQDLEQRQIPFDRATKAIVVEAEMAFDAVNNSGQSARTSFVLVRDYPADSIEYEDLFDLTGPSVGQPAYGMFIRNANGVTSVPAPFSLFYGGLGTSHVYQPFNVGFGTQWLPWALLSDGGEPGNTGTGGDINNQYVTTNKGNVWGDFAFHKVKWVLEPFRQRMYFDGELILEQTLPETSDTKFNYDYFDKVDALRVHTIGSSDALKIKNIQVRFITDHPLVEVQRTTEDHYVSNHGDYYVGLDTTSASYSVYMNAYPLPGDRVQIHDEGENTASNPVTIEGNGYNIEGASSFEFNVEGGSITFLFNGETWQIVQRTSDRGVVSGVTGWYYAERGGEQYVGADVSGSTAVIVLPQDPNSGDKYIIKDEEGNSSSNSITISGGVFDIDSFGPSTSLTVDEASLTFIFSGNKWRAI